MGVVHQVGFPVFSLDFAPNKPKLLVGGGGGSNKSGIKNSILYLEVDERTSEATKLSELKLSNEEDGCMSISVNPKSKVFAAGINSEQSEIKKNQNKNCRIFGWKEQEIEFKTATKTVDSLNGADFQKTCKFSPDGTLLLAGSTEGKLSVLKYPQLTDALSPIDLKAEVLCVDWHETKQLFVSCSPKNLYVHNSQNGDTKWSIEKPTQFKEVCEFRACAFGRQKTADYIFIILNAKSRKRSSVVQWKIESGSFVMRKSKTISSKPVTAFSMSHSGQFFAVGTADLSLTVLSATSLLPLMKLSNIHGFPVTCIAFSPSDQTVVTGSADGTFNVSKVRKQGSGFCGCLVILLFIILSLVASLFILGLDEWQEL